MSGSFAEKARQNLAAGQSLLELGHLDAAANRLYYAAFQAAVHVLVGIGKAPSDFNYGAERWRHDMVGNNAMLIRGDVSDRALFKKLRDLREVGDYQSVNVEETVVRSRLPMVIKLIEAVTG